MLQSVAFTSGTGKSHLLIALGTLAAEAGYRVRYTLASKLVNELVEAADDKQLTKLINHYGRVDLILVDEFLSQESGRAGQFVGLHQQADSSAIATSASSSSARCRALRRRSSSSSRAESAPPGSPRARAFARARVWLAIMRRTTGAAGFSGCAWTQPRQNT